MTTSKWINERNLSIVTVDFAAGQPKSGVCQGPRHMLEAGLMNQVRNLGWKPELYCIDSESLRPAHDPPVGLVKNSRFVGAVTKAVADKVAQFSSEKNFVVTLGGDHSLGLGTVSGILTSHPDAGVIWVDAHADINPPQDSLSGNLHGCPVAFVLGLANEYPGLEWVKPLLKPERIVYIGLRDVDAVEKQIIKKLGIKAFSMHEIDRYGIGQVVEMAIEHLNPPGQPENPIHLSFDVDAFDPAVAPATGTPVRGGLTYREGHYVVERLFETGCLVSMDVVEVNPALGATEEHIKQTTAIGCSLTRAGLGETLL